MCWHPACTIFALIKEYEGRQNKDENKKDGLIFIFLFGIILLVLETLERI